MDPEKTGSAGLVKPRTEQVPPPFDLKTPPADAVKTASGLVYKKMTTNDAGVAPKRNDTVSVTYTGWHQATGETFVTTKGRNTPWPINLANAAPGFTEGLQLMKKGERAVFWIPASIGYKGTQPPPGAEANVYDFEIVDVAPAPKIPDDVAKAPDSALATKSGIKYEIVQPGTGKESPRSFDNVTFNYTAWEANGRMFDSTEIAHKKPAKSASYRQTAAFGEILGTMVAGQRVRFWIDSAKMQAGHPLPNMPQGDLCYEVEILSIEKGVEPPQTPPDVAKPPADAQKTAKGSFYKVLRHGHEGGVHPKATDNVRVHYTGWHTTGELFDSSVTRGEPSEFNLQGVIAGWTEGVQLMVPGDKFRFWIPEELAYKGQPSKPQGMLVFDIELLEIKAPSHPDMPPGAPGMPPHHP